jgi:aminodeoxyfutalosine synthase
MIVEAGREPVERDTLYRRVVRDEQNFANWSVGEPVLATA